MEEIEKKLRRVSQTIAPFLSSVGSGRILSYVMTQAKEKKNIKLVETNGIQGYNPNKQSEYAVPLE